MAFKGFLFSHPHGNVLVPLLPSMRLIKYTPNFFISGAHLEPMKVPEGNTDDEGLHPPPPPFTKAIACLFIPAFHSFKIDRRGFLFCHNGLAIFPA